MMGFEFCVCGHVHSEQKIYKREAVILKHGWNNDGILNKCHNENCDCKNFVKACWNCQKPIEKHLNNPQTYKDQYNYVYLWNDRGKQMGCRIKKGSFLAKEMGLEMQSNRGVKKE